ncbi:lipase family protein [Francisella-like endosymbiont]|uniref:lipase family protein n=1 Tax=Francisella-like endosymbiont TaxID=512373 RepID=UPI001179D48F
MKEFIDKYSNTTPPEIIVLGHSLGRSLSTLMTYHIKSHILPAYAKNNPTMKNTKVYNISFSAPRFVDSKGAKIIEEKIGKGNIIRFWNARNLVPSIMLGSLNSKHVGIDIPLKDRFSHEWYKPILTHYSLCNVIGTSLKKVLRKSDMKISKK